MVLKFAIVSLVFAMVFQNACGNVNISCSTISTDINNVIQTESNQRQEMNQRTYSYNGNTYYYYYYYNYDDDDDADDSNAAISFPITNKFVKFLVHKILIRSNQWKKFNDFFNEGIVQNLNIRYMLNFPCTDKSKNSQTTVVEWSRNNVLNGILKGLEAINHKFEVIVDINFKDGFNEQCDNDLCYNPYSQDELKPLFCQVTNMLYLEWRTRNDMYDENYDYHTYDTTQCTTDSSDEQVFQFVSFEIAMGIFHLITFVMLTAYKGKIHKHVVNQLNGNRKKVLLFWSFIISLWLTLLYTVLIVLYYKVASSPTPYAWLTRESFYFVLSLGISMLYVFFFMLLHFPVTFCCFTACIDEQEKVKASSLCIPGTCFTNCCCFSYPFQSIAFYVLNSIPHIALLMISVLVLQFSNSPVPSVTVLVYSIILLAVNIVTNAYVLYLITSLCKSKDGWGTKLPKRCCYFLFGIIIAVAANIITVLVVISLVDFFFSDTEETSYTALLPGVLLTVVGWYYKGDLATYTGINAPFAEEGEVDPGKDSLAGGLNPHFEDKVPSEGASSMHLEDGGECHIEVSNF